ncbi:S1C family serine protease [Peribacillus sp. SCS-155]|uniref:S1C family serine protease n=1 Tax=Peribacillus sedimenti TaxID=3115297 RepID=UPI003905BB2D
MTAEPVVQVKKEESKEVAAPAKTAEVVSKPKPQAAAKQPSKTVAQIIKAAQPKVFTIFAGQAQGSGFLINKHGDVLTNAHVVEGSLDVMLHNNKGEELQGTVIGYSNNIDIAVIRVDALAGKEPTALETSKKSELGDEVIALGSPQGYENTATLGNISGVDRSFVIEPRTYEDIYQITAPIAPGSSGGPLLDKKSEKAIAINSAKHNGEDNIGFSIPLFKVMGIINGWVEAPMSASDISELFYNQAGNYFYQDMYGSDGEYYFDGGSYDDQYGDYQDYYDDYYGDDYSDESDSQSYSDDYSDESYEDESDSYSDDSSDEFDDDGSTGEYYDEEESEDVYEDGSTDEYSDDESDEYLEDGTNESEIEDEYIDEEPESEEVPDDEMEYEEEVNDSLSNESVDDSDL